MLTLEHHCSCCHHTDVSRCASTVDRLWSSSCLVCPTVVSRSGPAIAKYHQLLHKPTQTHRERDGDEHNPPKKKKAMMTEKRERLGMTHGRTPSPLYVRR